MTARWYIVHAYSNFEKKVAEDILKKAEQKGLSARVEQVVVPTEKVVEIRRGKKVDAERKFFPGYVLMKADLNDAIISMVKNIPRVTGFLGEDKHTSKPMHITDKEADRILHQVQEGVERPKPSVTFEIGEAIRVSDGPFASFNGFVQEVDEERARLKVEVSIFGRAVPVDLEFGQVEKG
ncbi:transcription termination/antitermination protein NusG [Mesorhizobium sp. A623]